MTLTDGTSSLAVAVNQNDRYGSATYFDKTTSVLEVQPGATVSFSSLVWTGAWMHAYVYVDYDNDGTFNTTLNADGSSMGELVSYSYYNEQDGDNATAPNSRGVIVSRASGVTDSSVPSFTVPANISSGDYRLRFKVDWNSLEPCGSTIQKDGGCIVDMTLRVAAPQERTVSVRSSDENKGTVSITGASGNSVTKAGLVEVNATPKSGYMFVNWTNDATAEVVSNQATTSVGGNDDVSLTANFDNFAYAGMKRYFTGSQSQQNRYLKRVTTSGTSTPEVFNATTQAELPYTAYTVSAGTKVEAGALIDKTTNPIRIEHGVSSFDITYYAWTDNIGSYSSEINWTQDAYYIDWNGNGSFADAGEGSEKGTTSKPDDEILTGATRTVSIPAGQEPGVYRMRLVFYEPDGASEEWHKSMFGTLNSEIRNGVAYDFAIEIMEKKDMAITSIEPVYRTGETTPGRTNVVVASLKIDASGSLSPKTVETVGMKWNGTANVKNVRWVYSATGTVTDDVVATMPATNLTAEVSLNRQLSPGANYLMLVADVEDDAEIGSTLCAEIHSAVVDGERYDFDLSNPEGIVVSDNYDYTLGNAIWFDTPNSSTSGLTIWNTNNFATTDTNPDQMWERKSYPIGNGSFGATIIGSIASERVVLNEKTLWKGGPATGVSEYWNMNNTVSPSTLSTIRQYLVNGNTSGANSLVSSNYRGSINYDSSRFGSFTTMGEAYVNTGINESGVTNYKRIMNMDRSIVVVQFESEGTKYQRRYFCSYPDSVMVWRYTSDGAPQNLTFSFNTPQVVNSVTSPEDGSLLYNCKLSNNNMQWALKVHVRTNDGGTVTANPTARTITVSGSNDVEFLLAGDTDYVMNFDPDFTDANAFVGVDPVESVTKSIENAMGMSYDQLYASHYDDYSALFDRVTLEINPSETYENLPTPTRLAKYRQGTLDHGLEQLYFQYGRYLLISSSRAGSMPANLQGLWHNNTEGPWRVDYHNNINVQMNYWPATNTNLLECFTPYIDYIRGLVKPGERTAQAYYGARGWTAEVSTNIFGFTAPLNASDMSWNYNPTAGPWLTTQLWEYYDYTRDKEWLREIGYPIIRSSANFVSDLLYLHNGTYTSAPSYSPEHGNVDLGATYANAVTREVLSEAIQAAEVLGENPSELSEWQEKLSKMYPYQIGRYGQLQEWYNDIDTYNDTHRHTNHLFGLHPGTSINVLEDTELAEACKETLRQRGDAATGWSMGWKLNHWARLLDGDHAYTLFQNLLKNGTADNMWDLHPPFQIDGNFGGTAGVTELFLQSHNGMLHLLPALPSSWTEGIITGLRTRGNFEVSIVYENGKLDFAEVKSNAGEDCTVYYNGLTKTFNTVSGGLYVVKYDPDENMLIMDDLASIDEIIPEGQDDILIRQDDNGRHVTVELIGPARGNIVLSVYNLTGQKLKSFAIDKTSSRASVSFNPAAGSGVLLLRAEGGMMSKTKKLIVR